MKCEEFVPSALSRRLSFVVCRLKEVGSRQSAVGSIGAFGDVASCKSQAIRTVAFGDGLKKALQSNANRNHSPLTIHRSSKYAGVNSRLQKHALQSNAPEFSIFHLSSSINSWASNPTLHSSRLLVTSFSLLVSTRFFTLHSSLDTQQESLCSC